MMLMLVTILQHLLLTVTERRISQRKKLVETQEALSDEVTVKANSVHDLAETIGKKLAAAEQLGADGNVEESIKLMEEVENMRKTKSEAEQDYRNSMPASSYQQQKLRVCEVCSAYLGIHDNDRRLADHFGGKLHLGFIQIREKLAELQACMDIRRPLKKEAKMKEIALGGAEKSEIGGFGRREIEERRRERERDGRGGDRDRRRRRSRSRSRGHGGHRRHRRSRSRGDRRRSRSRSGSKKVKKERGSRESRDSEDFAINSISADQKY